MLNKNLQQQITIPTESILLRKHLRNPALHAAPQHWLWTRDPGICSMIKEEDKGNKHFKEVIQSTDKTLLEDIYQAEYSVDEQKHLQCSTRISFLEASVMCN